MLTRSRPGLRSGAGLVVALAAVALAVAGAGCGRTQRAAVAPNAALRVSGDHLVIGSGAGRVVQLRGINRSGTEYRCEQGEGIFDSPTPELPDSAAMVAAMRSWDVDVVRVPLNEGCWLGHGAPARYSGTTYRDAIEAYVRELDDAGLFVILSLQWLDIDGTADYEAPMPDAADAPSFWTSVATAFRSDDDVLFDLYNEPFGVSWACWEAGCQVPAGSGSGGGGSTHWPSYRAVGMQRLVSAVRDAGADQPLLLGGLDYALNLSGWLAHEPSDPDHDLVASVHSYGGLSPCSVACEAAVLSIGEQVPVLFGELGETDCGTSYIDRIMAFADRYEIGYLGWAWDAVADGGWTCTGGPSLIDSYDGTPTSYGAGFQSHFQSRGPAVAAPALPSSVLAGSTTASAGSGTTGTGASTTGTGTSTTGTGTGATSGTGTGTGTTSGTGATGTSPAS